MKVWTAAEVEEVVGACTGRISTIVNLLRARRLQPAPDVIAWGQYLDEEHRTIEQWGLYGTAAAAQGIGVVEAVAGRRPGDHQLVAGALRLLPEDPSTGHELLDQKRDKHDFDNVLKLGAIVEALRPNASAISEEDEPPIVRHLRDVAIAEGGWSTLPPGYEGREIRGRELATAYVLHAWRRYDLGDVGLKARRWLAWRITEGEPIRGADLLALCGLALTAHQARPDDPETVRRAIERIETALMQWSREHDEVRVDRPMFKGFSVGATTDYLILHPEILTALFLLRNDNPTRGRAFVIEVAQAVSANIERNRGLTTSDGVIAAVDQLWAIRLLLELRLRYDRQGLESIVPPADEAAVREAARQHWRSSLAEAAEARRLWLSREAGYRQRAYRLLVVVAPLAVAILATALFIAHTLEGIVSIVGGLLTSWGVNHYFFLRAKEP